VDLSYNDSEEILLGLYDALTPRNFCDRLNTTWEVLYDTGLGLIPAQLKTRNWGIIGRLGLGKAKAVLLPIRIHDKD
jgi:hypothetical protein